MSAKCQDETFATRLNGLAAFTAVAISELPLIASTTLVMKTALTMIQVKLTSDVA